MFYGNNKVQSKKVGDFELSPMTAEWLSYMRGNPGGQYPNILKDFQWGVLNKCREVKNCDRQLIFVEGPTKKIDNAEILKDLNFRVYDYF